MRSVGRLLVLLATALQGCGHFLLLHLRGKPSVMERARWLHRWCSRALQRLAIGTEAHGTFPSSGLLVANHLSYLDILVFSALSPCVFVAKKEVRSWPLFGAMACMAGTVFVDRSRAAGVQRASGQMSEALSAGVVVVLFPEGTSSDGSTVLPFRPALFEPAVLAGEQVSCVHIRYELEAGSVANDVCYWGAMTFFPHLLRLLATRALRAKLRFGMEATMFGDRKLAAQVTRDTVAALAVAQGFSPAAPGNQPQG
jgi:1-acyl-sn-glycerol-3-phosphate acyltransferase